MIAVPWVGVAGAETLRLATYNVELSRKGPGLLLRDIARGDAQAEAAAEVIARVAPDVLLLNGIDYDLHLMTIEAFAARVAAKGHELPYRHAARPNRGWASGLDLDGDGRLGGPGDAHGWGRFAGEGGMAVLSRYPLKGLRDLSGLVWGEQDWAQLPVKNGQPFPSADARAVQRLSSVGHWVIEADVGRRALSLMVFHATPPVFDGPEDRNGKRNHDEIMLWRHLLDGRFEGGVNRPFAILGDANLDPMDGEGMKSAIQGLLGDKRLQDPRPGSAGGEAAADPEHEGSPGLDTVDWPGEGEGGPGNLRVDYVLPSSDLEVLGAGVYWPAPGQSGHDLAARASRHRLVWVDVGW
ncbi:endonuclease/exonuclease/phosphatase family protein [Aliisedimentitalea sp. MJ-SS2]|uniref:endonuclease/exonuclease/phosphatase family protein n=1 Tax=Aliisedimentitalea sp. MJ-SS2 TaxID=3049795 RepID=UPI00292F097F|nr:endonuclease/exonuclease/phosphatase family protein [Alisedimentitalea sp. MJ-SS2]